MIEDSKHSNETFQRDLANPENSEEMKIHTKETRLNGEMLRVKTTLHLKNSPEVWKIEEDDLPDYFNEY